MIPVKDIENIKSNFKNNENGTNEIGISQHNTVIASEDDQQSSSSPDRTFWEKRSIGVANHPCTHLCTSLIASLGIGIMGLILGGFAISLEGQGWESRGTLIAERHMQFTIVDYNSYEIFNDNTGEVWSDLTDSTNPNFFYYGDDDADDDHPSEVRRLQQQDKQLSTPRPSFDGGVSLYSSKSDDHQIQNTPFEWSPGLERRLQEVNGTGILEGCDASWYTSPSIFEEERLWPVWRLRRNQQSASFFDSTVLEELCLQEAKTQQYLVDNGLCFGCNSDDRCLQPYSLVLYARLIVEDGVNLDCQELSEAYASYTASIENDLVNCVSDFKTNYNMERDGLDYPESCPDFFSPTMLDERFDATQRVQYTSSVFATTFDDIDALYDGVDNYARGGRNIEGAYDTQDEDLLNLSLDDQLIFDMSLALASAFITAIAMIIHTKSPFLAGVGLLQISLSFPLAYTVYTFLGQLEFFPFLNFIGVFVLFALGADDVFVAVDKWKNARLAMPNASVQEIAAVAFPDAASAMLLTTATTSVAFFGTAVCPVAPIRCFAVFVGLLVVFDYLLCILLVFPALVIYDNRVSRGNNNCCISSNTKSCCGCFGCGKQDDGADAEQQGTDSDQQQIATKSGIESVDTDSNLIRRLLSKYYTILHKIRWPLLAVCAAAMIWSAVQASKIGLPLSSDVRLYDENDNQYEQNFVWRQNLLSDVLQRRGGSTAYVIWGVTPTDNGDMNNPDDWSKLVIDDSFNPSNQDAQVYLRDFCDNFFQNDFASRVESDYVCPINAFDSWLQTQASLEEPDSIYQDYCGGTTSLPMAEADFDACMYAWGQQENESTVLARDGNIKVMYIKFSSRIRFDSPYDDIDKEWNAVEEYMDNLNAPDGAQSGYFTSEDFWWYDTNGQMLRTAYASAGIAMAAAAGAILFSSRSIVLTLFSTITVGYVLASVTATLYAMGWTIGFLEAILFAILIGISCDFVIHFSHAYGHQPGEANRSDRTKYALLTMGPSILAAAFTTFAAATVMLFTVITFFEKFAVVLFMTVLQSTIGSFIVFIVIVDCVGPSHPTYIFVALMDKIGGGGAGTGSNKMKRENSSSEGYEI